MEIKKFIPMVTSKAILCEDLVQILPDIYYFWSGGGRLWKKNWMKLLVIWLTIVRCMCVWKDRVCSSSMVNLVLCNQCEFESRGVQHYVIKNWPSRYNVHIFVLSFLIILLNFNSKVSTKANISLPGGQYMFINR